MSATAAAARYVITADDKTKAAIASINNGFKSIEKNVKGTVKGINTSLSLLAGYGLKRAFQAIFAETAADSREFASALDDVKRSAKDLLSAQDGAPAATKALQELAETLKDPEVVQAADDLTSILIVGFARAAEATAGYFTLVSQGFLGWKAILGLTGDEVENLRVEIDRIDAQIKSLQDTLPGVSGRVAQQLRLDIAALTAQRNILAREQLKVIEGQTPTPAGRSIGFDTFLPGGLPGFDVGELNVADELRKQMEEFNRKENFIPGLDSAFTKRFKEFISGFESDINSGVVDSAQQAADSIAEIGDKLGEDIIGKAADLSVFAEEAARNMQSAFADFLFDPFEDGLKGMLKGFVDVIRRMIAEAAAAQIFESLFGTGKDGKSGAGTLIGSFLGGLFGSGGKDVPKYASGTDFVPRDQLAFLHRGEAVVPASMNKGGAGAPTININIDARGATPDFIKAMPEVLNRAKAAWKSELVRELKAGKYG